MHEMSLVRDIVDVVLDECAGTDIAKVKSVNLTIGELRDVILEYVPELFRFLARDTIASEAEVVINSAPALFACSQCGLEFRPANYRNPRSWSCPSCNAKTGFKLLSGMEFSIDSIEVEDASETVGPERPDGRLSA